MVHPQVIELREKGLSTKVIALAIAAWIRYMTGKGPIWGDAILGVCFAMLCMPCRFGLRILFGFLGVYGSIDTALGCIFSCSHVDI